MGMIYRSNPASPALDTPTATTLPAGDNSTGVATTAWVQNAINAATGGTSGGSTGGYTGSVPAAVQAADLWFDASNAATIDFTAQTWTDLNYGAVATLPVVNAGLAQFKSVVGPKYNGLNSLYLANNTPLPQLTGTDLTYFVVIDKFFQGTNTITVLNNGSTTPSGGSITYNGSDNDYYQVLGSASSSDGISAYPFVGGRQLLTMRYSAGQLRKNGLPIARFTPTQPIDNPTIVLSNEFGGTNPLDGSIVCEVVAFASAVSDTDTTTIESYLVNKWGINSRTPNQSGVPTTVPGMVAWFDASNEQSLLVRTVYAPSEVRVWADLSGNDHHANVNTFTGIVGPTPVVTTMPPGTAVRYGTVSVSDPTHPGWAPAVFATGSVVGSLENSFAGMTGAGAGEFTVFAVAVIHSMPGGASGPAAIINNGNAAGSAGSLAHLFTAGPSTVTIENGSSTSTTALSSASGVGYETPVQLTAVFGGATSVIRENGSVIATGAIDTAPITTAPVCIGNVGGTFGGANIDIAELLIYKTASLTTSEISAIENYLKTKWGIA